MSNNNTSVSNNNATKNRMQTMTLANGGGGGGGTNNNSAGNSNNSGPTDNNNGKSFQIPYPFLPPPQTQAMSAQNPMSPTTSPMLPPSTSMANHANMATVQHSPGSMANARPFSMDRVPVTNMESNNNQ